MLTNDIVSFEQLGPVHYVSIFCFVLYFQTTPPPPSPTNLILYPEQLSSWAGA